MSDFIDKLKVRAKQDVKTIVLAEGEDMRTLEAAQIVLKEGYAKIIILGNEAKILDMAKEKGLDLSEAKIIDPETSDKTAEYANKFYEMRKAKGMTPELAAETLKNVLYYGVMMVNEGAADGMVAGAVNSSANVIRPALQILKKVPFESEFTLSKRHEAERPLPRAFTDRAELSDVFVSVSDNELSFTEILISCTG